MSNAQNALWRRRVLPRAVLSAGLCGLFLYALVGRVGLPDLADAPAHLAHIPPLAWALAGLSTLASFWAIGRFEIVLHRHLRTGAAPARAARAARAGVAAGQCLGMGFVTGALMRWYCLPELGGRAVLRLTVTTAAAFMVAHLLLAGMLSPFALPGLWPVALVSGTAAALCLAAAFLRPEIALGRWRLRLPSVPACWAIFVYAALDIFAAALTLYVFLPEGLPFAAVLASYLMAFFAALVVGTPGGLGTLELGLIALLPTLASAEGLAAVLAFRIVYFALPGLWALSVALRPRVSAALDMAQDSRAFTHPPARAEQWLLAGHETEFFAAQGAQGGAIRTAQTLSLYLGPLAGPVAPLLPALLARARRQNRVALLYRVPSKVAIAAQKAGWRVLAIAEEAVVDTAAFQLDGAERRQLRRQLRKAEKAGVVTVEATGLPPLSALAAINTAWARDHGREKGVTMGHFAPHAILSQRLFLAMRDGRPIAFASFHHIREEWCLDLMRHLPDAPAGTMHSLVLAAIEAARAEGVPTLSLAAVPTGPGWVRARAAGLRRFKASFAPAWQPRYLCAPDLFSLVLGGMDLVRAIHAKPAGNLAQESVEDYEFEAASALWQAGASDTQEPEGAAHHDQQTRTASRVA